MALVWKRIFKGSIVILISVINCVSTLECIPSQHLSPDDHLQVSIIKLRRGNNDNQTSFNSSIPIFELGEAVIFRLECKSHVPVKWVFDEDFFDRGIKNFGNSLTSRVIGNLSDEKSYKFTAPYDLQINSPETQDPLIIVCQTIANPCERRTVLSSFHKDSQKYNVKLLTKFEEVDHINDFEMGLSKAGNTSGQCPFNLTLRYDRVYKALIFLWTPSGSIAEFTQESAQSFENAYRFTPTLDERCIDFSFDTKNLSSCKNCTQLNWNVTQFRPIIFYNAVGDNRRVLKGFFDIKKRDFFYSWEYADPQHMMFMKTPKEAYKGQEISISCDSSLFLFSLGTQISWSIEGEVIPRDFVSGIDLYDRSSLTTYGTINTKGTVRPSKSYLDENNIQSLNISCIAPIWNSTGWVTISKMVRLVDSISPIVHDFFTPSITEALLGQEYILKCKAEGFPPPSLEIILPQENLNFTQNVTTQGNYSELVVTISKIELTNGGNYTCVAKNVVGRDFKFFHLNIPIGLGDFSKFMIIGAGVVTVAFLAIAIALTFKLRKEKEDFIKLTEETILQFQQGFKNTTGIAFNSSSEYKDYEVPIGRWGMSGTLLGSGAFGVVQKGFIEKGKDKTVLAIKTVNSPKDVVDFQNSLMELTIMAFIGHHEHIVSLIAACTDNIHKRSVYIGVEYCADGDLLTYLQKRRSLFHSFVKGGQIALDWVSNSGPYANVVNTANFSTIDLYKWAYQIADGMEFLESKKVLHADLAARNVLLNNLKCKICDFGLSRKLLDSSNYTKTTNSPLPWRWMAIESLKFQQFSPKSDIWSYGVTLYEIFSLGAEPWPELGWTVEFVNELENGRRLTRPNFATENMYNAIMLECWRNEPEERLTFALCREFFEIGIARLNSTEGKSNEYLSVC